jgi:hypothetical protein
MQQFGVSFDLYYDARKYKIKIPSLVDAPTQARALQGGLLGAVIFNTLHTHTLQLKSLGAGLAHHRHKQSFRLSPINCIQIHT